MSDNHQDTVDQIDHLLDEVDELLGELPIANDKRKQLSSLLFKFFEQLEDEMIMRSADWEA